MGKERPGLELVYQPRKTELGTETDQGAQKEVGGTKRNTLEKEHEGGGFKRDKARGVCGLLMAYTNNG